MARVPQFVAEAFLNSRKSLEAQIKAVSKRMGSLYPRSWVDVEGPASASSSSSSSHAFATASASAEATASLVFMQFNMLAEGLSGDPSVVPPFSARLVATGGFHENLHPGWFHERRPAWHANTLPPRPAKPANSVGSTPWRIPVRSWTSRTCDGGGCWR